jgi:hypothetical protein
MTVVPLQVGQPPMDETSCHHHSTWVNHHHSLRLRLSSTQPAEGRLLFLLCFYDSEGTCIPEHVLGSVFLAMKWQRLDPVDDATRWAPCNPTTLLRIRSCPLIVSITIHDTKMSQILVVSVVALNVMNLHAFEAL